jgi:hypothetical protein
VRGIGLANEQKQISEHGGRQNADKQNVQHNPAGGTAYALAATAVWESSPCRVLGTSD